MIKERISTKTEINSIAELSLDDLQGLANEYYYSLWNFAERTGVTEVLYCRVDHLAIKARDTKDYEEFMSKASGFGEILSEEPLNNRRIAIVKLDNPIFVGELGYAYLLEVMEPKPESVGNDNIGVDHVEAAVLFFDKLVADLRAKGLTSQIKDNGFHRTFPFIINEKTGWEFKFSDRGLGNVISLQQSAR